MTEAKLATLNTIVHHRACVAQALQVLIQTLERRALVHDLSKFEEAEFEGFARINETARRFPYGSPEYRASLKAEKPTIERHYRGNSHHPEYWDDHGLKRASEMGLLDLVEMAADWWAAWKVYDGQRAPEQRSSWRDNIDKQRARFLESGILSAEQWFVVEEVAHLLGMASL